MENLKEKAWPFLVSRNSQLDYWPLVVHPSFLEKPLVNAVTVSRAPTSPDCAIYREICNSPVGNVALVFRVLQVKRSFVDLPGTDLLRDQSQRPIKIFEGIVLEGLVPHITITEKDFQIIHEPIKPVYKNFWVAGEKRDTIQKRPSIKSLPFFFLTSDRGRTRIRVDSATNTCLTLLVEAPFVVSPEPAGPSRSKQGPIPSSNEIEDQPGQKDIPMVPLPQRGNQRRVILIGASLLILLIIVVLLIKLASR